MNTQKKYKARFSSLISTFFLLFTLLGGFSSRVVAQGEATPSATNTALSDETPTTLATTPTPTETIAPEPTGSATPSPTITSTPNPYLNVPQIKGDYVEDEILVQFRVSTGNAQAATKDCFANGQAEITSAIGAIDTFVLKINSISVSEAIARAEDCPNILLVEPNYHLYATDTFPNDPNLNNQYGLTAIRAPQGWDTTTGSAAVIIAVVDTGVALSHPDLAGKIVAGYDFVNNDEIAQDDNGHGTHVAGIAAASSNNGTGIAGASWGARIMPIKVLNANAGGSFSNVAAGIIWATDHGAHIINLSLGGTSHSTTFQNAIDYAYSNGVTLVAASGNAGSSFVLYPARYPNVIAVGATDSSNNLAFFSNYGAEIDVVAPGVNIYSTWLGNLYQNDSGTSMSTPYVAGLAAILRGIPESGSPANLAWAIKSTALDLGVPGRDNFYGDGIIQMDAAIAFLWVTPTSTLTSIILPTETSISNPAQPGTGFSSPNSTQTSTATATPSQTASPTQTLVISTITISPPLNIDEGDNTSDLFALSSPMPNEHEKDETESNKILLPCLGFFLILLGMALFWLGKGVRKKGI